MARDCTVNKDPNAVAVLGGPSGNKGFDSEYASLMAELGESADMGRGGAGGVARDITAGGSSIPPWRRPEVWQTNAPPAAQPQPSGYRPPAAYGAMPAYGAPGQGWGGAGYPQVAPATGYGQSSQGYEANYAQYYQNQYSQQQLDAPAH
jgi:splicing factor 1